MKFNFPRSQPKKRMTAIRLTEDQYNYLTKLAKQQTLSLPETINVMLQAAIDEHKSL